MAVGGVSTMGRVLAYLTLIFSFFVSSVVLGANPRRISKVSYFHSTVGTTAQDAIPAGNVITRLQGWRICHDAGSTAGYLAVSNGADPATDGIRIAPDSCYLCDDCGSRGLLDANVKADAASTGYSVLQLQ